MQTYSGDIAPSAVIWPNGDASHAVSLGFERAGCRFVQVKYGPDSPGEFYDNTAINPNLVGNTLNYVRTWTPQDLSVVQKELCRRVDSAADSLQLEYITPGFGQAMVYQRKTEELSQLKADTKPDVKNYPLLSASIGIEGDSLSAIADVVEKATDLWVSAAKNIENVRLSSKKLIMSASKFGQAIDYYYGIQWPK